MWAHIDNINTACGLFGCLCLYGLRADYSVLDKQQGGSSLGEANFPSSSRYVPVVLCLEWDSVNFFLLHIGMFIDMVPVLLRQPILGSTLTEAHFLVFWCLCLLAPHDVPEP